MSRFTLATAASIAAGLSIGAAMTVGVTLAVEDRDAAPAQRVLTPSTPHPVAYGDRCYKGYCLPPIPPIPHVPRIPLPW
jgi:hypothetical protein